MDTCETEHDEPAPQKWSVKRQLVALGITIIVVAALLSGAIAGTVGVVRWKESMDKRAMERTYQAGMEQVQETFTEYLLENYEGVTAVEWQGVEIEWRNSPVYGPSLFGDGVFSYFKVYVNDTDYFTDSLWLSDEMEYDDELERYLPNGVLNPKNMDFVIESDMSDLREEKNDAFSGFRKSAKGSPDAQVTYDVRVSEFKY